MTPWNRWRSQQPEAVLHALGTLWGKSDAAGRPNLLAQHLLDTAAVAEQLWDHFLAPTLREQLHGVSGDSGRRFFAWLCGVHDVGKATPAFQQQDRGLAQRVRAAGLTWSGVGERANRAWRHERGSARIIADAAQRAGWSEAACAWVWPLLAGHHGVFPDARGINPRKQVHHGRGREWDEAQQALVGLVTSAVGYVNLGEAEPHVRPPRALQLAMSGFVVMADWVASDERHFPGIDELGEVSPDRARERAERAWQTLGLRRGWGQLSAVPEDPVRARFGLPARPSQRAVIEAASSMRAPGLLIVEAPTGEGKTEAALAAAEILAARAGADGVFVGMPTQATSDPMLHRVGLWANQVHPGIQVALLHGKRRFNPEWRELLGRRKPTDPPEADVSPLDEHDLRDDYGQAFRPGGVSEDAETTQEAVAAVEDWLLGPKRGLLSPVAVGTVDQLLFAATRTKHVALRFAGLAGKVVILDEVHAADIYMEQFVLEALWWLAECGVSVILLTATLSPRQRHALVREYMRGAASDPRLEPDDVPEPDGYPSVTTAWADARTACGRVTSADAWRPAQNVAVEILDEDETDPTAAVTARVRAATDDGGCVLVLRNTVPRAQQTYRALRGSIDGEVTLLHGRLSAADRADRADRLLSQLGPPDTEDERRPQRLVVVATQVAEQSFDVDVDLLISDLAPADLLLQRAGRLHRHNRSDGQRPPALTEPRIVVTGLCRQPSGPPGIDPGTLAVYGEGKEAHSRSRTADPLTPYQAAAPLLRTAALAEAAATGSGWRLPDQVPGLVAAAYGNDPTTPPAWRDAEQAELEAFRALQERRAHSATSYRLARGGSRSAPTLEGLHGGTESSASEEELTAVVRDGPQGAEVLLVHQEGERYRSLHGHDLGMHGERINDSDGLNAVLGGTVRLPSWPGLTEQAEQLGPQLPEWREHPWTRHANVLILEHGEAELGGYRIRYDPELGLIPESRHASTPAEAGTT